MAKKKKQERILFANIPKEFVIIDGQVYLFDNGVFRKINKG